ncbi:hypothetical protein [Novosphingobium kaempferiae]|uniref:hypothetical protein n=1 Tax=Novosphingobium kaempferiae TaxID=2896849 RepID=UPI001E2AB244|nr:hypothetical protein [Novosphingobium kaempferiae]
MVIGSAREQNDNQADLPAYLQAEHAAAILKRAQYRTPTETEIRWARRCLTNALAALTE